jgi:hypothetical protein
VVAYSHRNIQNPSSPSPVVLGTPFMPLAAKEINGYDAIGAT